MKSKITVLVVAACALVLAAVQPGKTQAQAPLFQAEECLTIHWDGRDNFHVIRPNGKVEFLGKVLGTIQRPNRTDERAFYLNLAMNALAKEGYQFAGCAESDIVMKRSIPRP